MSPTYAYITRLLTTILILCFIAPEANAALRLGSETLLRLEDANQQAATYLSAPLYEFLDLNLGNLWGHRLSFSAGGWLRLGIGEKTLPDRNNGKLSYGVLQLDAAPVRARLGRQLITIGGMNEPLDGGALELGLPAGVGLAAYGGKDVNDIDKTTWGGRLGWSCGIPAEIGLSALMSSVNDDRDRERVGVDAVLRAWSWLEIGGWGYYDFLMQRTASVRASIRFKPLVPLFLGVEYDQSDPAAFLGATSLFTVFTDKPYRSASFRAEYTIPVLELIPAELTPYEIIERIVLAAEARRLWYESEPGAWRSGGEVRIYFTMDAKSFFALGAWRQAEPERGYTDMRGAILYWFTETLYGFAEGIVDMYDHDIRGYKTGLMGQGGAGYKLSLRLRLQASGELRSNPLMEREGRAMIKVVWEAL